MSNPKQSVAIVGAGMAGLSCAQALSAAGHKVTLFDKGRGPGGRMATRRAEVAGQIIRFDHGAQYFKALGPAFASACEQWRQAGAVADWPAAGKHALVGSPGMNGVIRQLAEGLDVRWGVRIERIERDEAEQQWTLTHAEGSQIFDAVVCAVPAEQATELLRMAAAGFSAKAGEVQSAPCWAAMAAFEAPLNLPDCIAGEGASPIAWAARNSAKPDRESTEAWVIHASAGFSREILDLPKEDAAERLLAEFFAQTGQAPVEAKHLAAHRWLYAFPESAEGDGLLWDASQNIGVCGDWLTAPNAEGAWLSGQYLAAAILNSSQ